MRRFLSLFFLLGLAFGLTAQDPRHERPDKLPDGRSRELAILKEDHEKSLEDIAEIRKLAEELEKEIQEQTAYVTSMDSLRKAEKIEDLAEKLQKRMKRIP
ncbi:MAG: hypothetical protein R2748_06745 [Bryobacterales bacterium]